MSGVTGALVTRLHGESDAVLLLSPKDGGALASGTDRGSADNAMGDRRILVAGDIPKVISLMGLPSRLLIESLGISRAGYLFRLERLLAQLFLLESEAKVVGSLVRDAASSLKTVPASLLTEYDVRAELRRNPSPALLAGERPSEETGEDG